MAGDERSPKFMDKFWAKASKDPFVPIGALATVGFLVSGMSFQKPAQTMNYSLYDYDITKLLLYSTVVVL